MQICYEIGFKLSAKMPPCKNLVHFKQNKKKTTRYLDKNIRIIV